MRRLARLFWYLFKLALIIAAIFWFAQQPGEIRFTIFDYLIEMPSGLFLALLVILLILTIFTARLLSWLGHWPERWRRQRERKNWLRGKDAVLGGLIALHMGDRKAAEKYLKRIERNFTQDPLLHILKSQNAWRMGDWEEARRSFHLLERNKSTASLGKAGLFRLAIEQQNKEEAWQIGRNLLSEAVLPQDVLSYLFLLAIERQDWVIALHALEAQDLEKDALFRKKAALYAEKARHALHENNPVAAKEAAKQALKAKADFTPARILLIEALLAANKHHRARKILARYWQETPEEALLPLFQLSMTGESAIDQARLLNAFVNGQAEHPASLRLAARINLNAGLWGEARRSIHRLAAFEEAGNGLSASTCLLAAELEEQEGHQTEAATWLKKLPTSRSDAIWHCRACDEKVSSWSFSCPHCQAVDSILWGNPTPSDRLGIQQSNPRLIGTNLL